MRNPNVRYVNQHSRRNRKCTANLEDKLGYAVRNVYGPGFRADIYSGGQDRKGEGDDRTGEIRHDDYGDGGRALDAYVYSDSGSKLFGVELARLGQYWLAMNYGCCGIEMSHNGIHLDEWVPPPSGKVKFWFYGALEGKSYAATVKRMIRAGAERRKNPTLYNGAGSVKRISASVGRNGVNRNHDVATVQQLINDNISPSWTPRGPLWPYPTLSVDGLAGPNTIAAIGAFQLYVGGMVYADSRVDPGRRTIRLLNEIHETDL